MKHTFWISALLLSLCCTAANAQTRTSFLGQIQGLANDVKDALRDDPRVQNQKLQLGEFDGKGEAKATNFGGRIKKILQEELASSLSDASEFTLTGGYRYVESADPTQKGLRILLLSARIEDRREKEVVTLQREVNDSDDIFQVLGLTGARPTSAGTGNTPPKPQVELKKNNQAAKEAQEKPKFDVQGGTRIAAVGFPHWSMAIHKKQSHDGTGVPVPPQNVKGLAFVPVAISEYYDIELVNHDQVDVVATLTVDGLDVANTFAVDKDDAGKVIHWPGYLVPAGQSVLIRGWLHTIDQHVKDNVFSFKVAELGQGAASPIIGRGAVGVITVQFREACPPDGRLTGRSVGETAKGEGLQEKLTAKPVLIGENVLSTISIRYNRPE
jgi:hypothetical protein